MIVIRGALCAAVALFALVPMRAEAQTPAVIDACLNPGNGGVRIVRPNEPCKSAEARVQWNIVGPQGPAGARGPQGEQGVAGAIGPAGPQGSTGAQGPIGMTGPTGPQGPIGMIGDTGAPGPVGPAGPAGPQGPIGVAGADGDAGPAGAQGPQGSQGPQGPSGFVTALFYEAAPSVALNSTVNSPVLCASAPYVAGANEQAILSVDFSVLGTGTTVLYLAPMYSVNSGAPAFAVGTYALDRLMNASWSSIHNSAVVSLTAGASYRFTMGVKTDIALASASTTCHGVATIVRKP